MAPKEHRKANHMKKVLEGNATVKSLGFKKRFPTLKKKAKELQTLCNVSVGMICFGQDGKFHTFPEDETALKDLAVGFQVLNENAKKETNLIQFLEQHKIKKLDEKFLKLSKRLEGLSDSNALEFLESKLAIFKKKLEFCASKEQDLNTYGCNIVGSGLEEDNWIREYNIVLENNPSFQNNFIVSNCNNLPLQ